MKIIAEKIEALPINIPDWRTIVSKLLFPGQIMVFGPAPA